MFSVDHVSDMTELARDTDMIWVRKFRAKTYDIDN